MRVASFWPYFFVNNNICYCAFSIIEAMESDVINGSIMTAASKGFKSPHYSSAIPPALNAFAYRFFSENQLKSFTEFRFLQKLDGDELIYLWGQCASIDICKKLHDRGHQIIVENLNTHRSTSKAILDAEYFRLGLQATHGITSKKVDEEIAVLELVDFNFSCSPEVKKSLIKANISDASILDTSYGLRESDILSQFDVEKRADHHDFTVIFVGSIGIRKGAHLLLDYWCKSKIKGKLQLVGNIEEDARHLIEPYLQREDIEHIPYINDLRDVYRNADLFVLPSLEEGSPLVTYLALGAGLPSIVSPMGSGGLIEHGEDGLVLDPHDDVGWVQALQKMAEDFNVREKLSRKAHQKAPTYLWSKVGRQRADILMSRVEKGS